MTNQQHNLDLLKLEYEQCNAGYNSRDGLVLDGFAKIVQNFNIYMVILFAFNKLITTDPTLRVILLILLGVAGFLTLFAQTVDLESNMTCKVVLRSRATQIEEIIEGNLSAEEIWDDIPKKKAADLQNVRQWHLILERRKFLEEEKVKGEGETVKHILKEMHENESISYITVFRIFYILWSVMVGISIFAGDLLKTP